MKYIGSHTIRGFVENESEVKVNLFDGSFGTAFKVTKFEIVIRDPDNSGNDGFGILSYEPNTPREWQLENNLQFGWASMYASGNATGPTAQPFNLVDRENLIVEDFYIYGEMHAPGAGVNYYIEMDKFEISEYRGALQLVRNSSQG